MLLHLRAGQLPAPHREYMFHATRRWRFDFAWPDRRLALEVEGGAFSQGRHARGTGFTEDCEKYSEAALAGWIVLRATTAMVEDGRALALVERAFEGHLRYEQHVLHGAQLLREDQPS